MMRNTKEAGSHIRIGIMTQSIIRDLIYICGKGNETGRNLPVSFISLFFHFSTFVPQREGEKKTYGNDSLTAAKT